MQVWMIVPWVEREVEAKKRNLGGEGIYTCPPLAVITRASLPFTGTQARNNKLANHAPNFSIFVLLTPRKTRQFSFKRNAKARPKITALSLSLLNSPPSLQLFIPLLPSSPASTHPISHAHASTTIPHPSLTSHPSTTLIHFNPSE